MGAVEDHTPNALLLIPIFVYRLSDKQKFLKFLRILRILRIFSKKSLTATKICYIMSTVLKMKGGKNYD